jgi:CRISPR-associated protein Cmr2
LGDALARLAGAGERRLADPVPYYALLLADGDNMGPLISRCADPRQHQRISEALSGFAQEVPPIVNGHRGACVYSGGDDVLALLRTDKALACADELRQRFQAALEPIARELGAPSPTLSAGIAVAHMLEPLGDCRALARKAEHLAKEGPPGTPVGQRRNAVAWIVKPRSGDAYAARVRWDDLDAVARVRGWIEAFLPGATDPLPSGLPYELRALFGRCSAIFDPAGQAAVAGFAGIEADALRELWEARLRVVLGKKRLADGSKLSDTRIRSLQGDFAAQAAAPRIDEMLVARWLAGHTVMERA